VSEQRDREHENKTASVRQQSDDKSVGALRGIATSEVTGAPAQHCRQAEADGDKLFGGGQS